MAVDLSGIPQLPDTGSIHEAASSMRTRAERVTDTYDNARWQWRLIENQIVSPDLHDEMVSALDVMQDFGLVVDISVDEVASALDEYAERIEGISSRYHAVMAEAQVCHAQPTTAEEAEAARERDERIQADVNELVRKLQEWEKDCADKIDEANRSDAVWDGGAATTPQGGAALTAVETLLDHLGMKENVREEMKAVVVMTDVSPVNMTVTMADGKVYEWHALSPEHTAFVEKEKIIDHEVRFHPDAKTALPPELKPIKHLLGPASISITAYSNFVDEWNDDLIENPDYSQLERVWSAVQSAGWGGSWRPRWILHRFRAGRSRSTALRAWCGSSGL